MKSTMQTPSLINSGAPDATSSNELIEKEPTQKILSNEFQIQSRWLKSNQEPLRKKQLFQPKS